MGLFRRIFRKSDSTTPTQLATRAETPRVEVTVAVDRTLSMPDLVKLAGTTTGAKQGITALAQRLDPDDVGYLEVDGVIQREPENPVDPFAVIVLVQGERIGYLPGYIAKHVDLSVDGAREVRVQIFTQLFAEGLRSEAWAWLGSGAPTWDWSESTRPPMSTTAKIVAKQRGTDYMVTDALAGGGERAKSFTAGMVDGVHYLQLVEPIKALKREGRLEEALVLCYKAIEGAEKAARREKTSPPPAYTEHAAIIHRKLKQRAQEIAVLQRYVDACPPRYRDSSIKARLDKLLE